MEQIASSPRQLGALVQRIRQEAGLNQTEAANLVGLRQEIVSQIETGQAGVRLSAVYSLLGVLNLELVVRTRARRSDDDREDIE